jgi:hypothetical protein
MPQIVVDIYRSIWPSRSLSVWDQSSACKTASCRTADGTLVDYRDVVRVESGSGSVLLNVKLNDTQASSQARPATLPLCGIPAPPGLSLHSSDRRNLGCSERLRLTQRVVDVRGLDYALSLELNPKTLLGTAASPRGS